MLRTFADVYINGHSNGGNNTAEYTDGNSEMVYLGIAVVVVAVVVVGAILVLKHYGKKSTEKNVKTVKNTTSKKRSNKK